MPGLDCKQVICIEQLMGRLRAVNRLDRKGEFSDEDREAIIHCLENTDSDLKKILSTYT